MLSHKNKKQKKVTVATKKREILRQNKVSPPLQYNKVSLNWKVDQIPSMSLGLWLVNAMSGE